MDKDRLLLTGGIAILGFSLYYIEKRKKTMEENIKKIEKRDFNDRFYGDFNYRFYGGFTTGVGTTIGAIFAINLGMYAAKKYYKIGSEIKNLQICFNK